MKGKLDIPWRQRMRNEMRWRKEKMQKRLHALRLWLLNKKKLKLYVKLSWSLWIFLLFGLPTYFIWHFWEVIGWNFQIAESLPTKCKEAFESNNGFRNAESCSAIARNFGLTVGVGFSLIVAISGLAIAWWGRWLQNKSNERERLENLEERYTKAADMLSSGLEATRIAACLSLADLGKADESMKSRCVRLLFAFINNPPLKDGEKGKSFDKLFPADKPLRFDIQEAITSFSAIYEHYGDAGVDDEAVRLPSYFWKNKKKGKIFLTKAKLDSEEILKEASLYNADLYKAKLDDANLQNAHLIRANLQQANLNHVRASMVKLQEADLREARFQGANLEKAELNVANLQKANLLKANLSSADLQGANLKDASLCLTILHEAYMHGVELEGADFEGAILLDADISVVDMRKVKNLTKEQILSAIWGYGGEDNGPKGNWSDRYSTARWNRQNTAYPKLPEYLMQDKDIKEWLQTPAYDLRGKFKKGAGIESKSVKKFEKLMQDGGIKKWIAILAYNLKKGPKYQFDDIKELLWVSAYDPKEVIERVNKAIKVKNAEAKAKTKAKAKSKAKAKKARGRPRKKTP